MYVAGLALFTIASAACALAPSALGVLVGVRAVQGVGAAFVMPLGLTLLTSAFPLERRGAVIGVGRRAGAAWRRALVGGAVTEGLSWHWIFWVNVPIGIVASLRRCGCCPRAAGGRPGSTSGRRARLGRGRDGLVWGLVQGATWVGTASRWSPRSRSARLCCAFVRWERRASEPMLPPQLFRIRAFAVGIAT